MVITIFNMRRTAINTKMRIEIISSTNNLKSVSRAFTINYKNGYTSSGSVILYIYLKMSQKISDGFLYIKANSKNLCLKNEITLIFDIMNNNGAIYISNSGSY